MKKSQASIDFYTYIFFYKILEYVSEFMGMNVTITPPHPKFLKKTSYINFNFITDYFIVKIPCDTLEHIAFVKFVLVNYIPIPSASTIINIFLTLYICTYIYLYIMNYIYFQNCHQ